MEENISPAPQAPLQPPPAPDHKQFFIIGCLFTVIMLLAASGILYFQNYSASVVRQESDQTATTTAQVITTSNGFIFELPIGWSAQTFSSTSQSSAQSPAITLQRIYVYNNENNAVARFLCGGGKDWELFGITSTLEKRKTIGDGKYSVHYEEYAFDDNNPPGPQVFFSSQPVDQASTTYEAFWADSCQYATDAELSQTDLAGLRSIYETWNVVGQVGGTMSSNTIGYRFYTSHIYTSERGFSLVVPSDWTRYAVLEKPGVGSSTVELTFALPLSSTTIEGNTQSAQDVHVFEIGMLEITPIDRFVSRDDKCKEIEAAGDLCIAASEQDRNNMYVLAAYPKLHFYDYCKEAAGSEPYLCNVTQNVWGIKFSTTTTH